MELLNEFKGTDAVVLALPRGGVIIGQEIAGALNLPLDIIVDDGIATGFTMQVAVAYVKNEGAAKVAVAVPVASTESVRALKDTSEVFVLETPTFFSAVGEWYEDFPQVTDEEVVKALAPKSPL